MRYKTKTILLTILTIISYFALGSHVMAKDNLMREMNTRNQKKPENLEMRCQAMQRLIENRLKTYNSKKEIHRENYQRYIAKVEEIIQKLDSKGKDTSQAKSELSKLEELVTLFVKSVEDSASTLEEANDYNCGQSEGEFKTRIKETKVVFEETREIAKQIREQMKTLRQALRVAAQSTSNESE